MSGTDSTRAAREHARAQAGTVVEAMPTVPAADWPDPPTGVDARDLTWAEVIAGGGASSKVLARGTTIRLRDRGGDACAHLLLFNAEALWERLNVADTVKVPWRVYLGTGHPLLSDQGRVLATIVEDRAAAHDALCSYGAAARAAFVNLAAKHGLTPRDLSPGISFFKGVRVREDGSLIYQGGSLPSGTVTLRCELPLVVLIVNAPHPLDPEPAGDGSALELLAWRGHATAPGEPLWSSSPELQRAFENTTEYWHARA